MIILLVCKSVRMDNIMQQEVFLNPNNNFKGAEKTVILWDSNFKPIKKYSHIDSVLSISFNPVTNSLFSSCNQEYITCMIDNN